MWIDLAMYQVGVSFIGEGVLDYAFNGRRSRRLGNRHEHMSPHGCYPCKGQDEWVVLAVRDDTDWRAFCRVIGEPDLASHPQFTDPIIRYQHQDELDPIIARWTSVRGQYEVMEQLQACGVPAGPVLNAKQLLAAPHLRDRGFFEPVEHPPGTGLGRREYLGRGWRLSGNDIRIRQSAPALGEANQYVLRDILGLTRVEIEELRRTNALGQMLEGAQAPSTVPLERQVELGWIVAQDSDYQEFLSRVTGGRES